MPSNDHSVSRWLRQVKEGDSSAAQKLWGRYLFRLTSLAKRQLGDSPRGVEDEEDVTVEAFRLFLDGALRGSFPRLQDRQDLWQVLGALTSRKAIEQRRRVHAKKRGDGQVIDQLQFAAGSEPALADVVAHNSPSPQEAAELQEQLAMRLDGLNCPIERRIAAGKLAGFTNVELAEELNINLRAVERKLNKIRASWEKVCHEQCW